MAAKITFLNPLLLKELNVFLEILETLKGKYSICLVDLDTNIAKLEKIDNKENTILIWYTKINQSISCPKVEKFHRCVKLFFNLDDSFDPTIECNSNTISIFKNLGEDETPLANPPDMLPPIKTQKICQVIDQKIDEELHELWQSTIREWLRTIVTWKNLAYPLFKKVRELDCDDSILTSIRQLNKDRDQLRKIYENNMCEEYSEKLKEHADSWKKIYEDCKLLEEKLQDDVTYEKEIEKKQRDIVIYEKEIKKKQQDDDIYYSSKKRFY